MRFLCWFLVFAVVAVLAPIGSTARNYPLGPLMVDAPPLANNDSANAIFDAMLAIARAKATYPAGAADAAATYGSALQKYNAGDRTTAWTNALQAIALASRRPYPEPAAWGSPSPSVVGTAPMPELVEVGQAQAESMLGIGRRALIDCGASDPALLQALRTRYSAGVAENLRHDYAQVLADAQTIVDACAVVLPAQSPTPAAH